MTEGNPYRLMLAFTLPLLCSQLFQQLYNTADTFIVARYLGTEALAAVSSSGMLIMLLTNFFVGTAMGAAVVIGKYFGAKDYGNVSRAIHTDLAFGLLAGAALTLVGVLLTPTFLRWMRTDPEVLPQAIEYFRYYFLGSLATVMYNLCTGILNALGDSRRPLYYLIFSSLLNIALDLVFIGGFGWGVWSAATATVISQLCSFLLCMKHLLKKDQVFTVTPRKIRIHPDIFLEIVRYGLPSGIQNCVISFANVIVQSQINTFGKLATAAFGTHCKIEGFVFLPIQSFNMATTTFISQNLGAKLYDRAKAGARFGILLPMAMATAMGIVYYFIAPGMVALFDSDPGVVMYGTMHGRIVCLFFALMAFSHTVASVFRGAGKAFVPMLVMLGVWCVFRLMYIFTVMHLFGEIQYIYWAYPITWCISSVIYLVYYLRADWIHGFEAAEAKRLRRQQS